MSDGPVLPQAGGEGGVAQVIRYRAVENYVVPVAVSETTPDLYLIIEDEESIPEPSGYSDSLDPREASSMFEYEESDHDSMPEEPSFVKENTSDVDYFELDRDTEEIHGRCEQDQIEDKSQSSYTPSELDRMLSNPESEYIRKLWPEREDTISFESRFSVVPEPTSSSSLYYMCTEAHHHIQDCLETQFLVFLGIVSVDETMKS